MSAGKEDPGQGAAILCPPPEKRLNEALVVGLILLSGLLLRLYELAAPPVDFLCWRDTQTLMVARNFYREGMNLFSPSVDWRTTTEFAVKGTVGGTELQVVPISPPHSTSYSGFTIGWAASCPSPSRFSARLISMRSCAASMDPYAPDSAHSC